MTSKRVWVIGTVSWDTVIHVNEFPQSGGFAQGFDRQERLGGSAANLAQGLATTGVETGLLTFLGHDELGEQILHLLEDSQIHHLKVLNVADNSPHAIVVIDGTGERTVLALSNNYLHELSLKEIGLQKEDIVVFALWRPVFLENLNYARSLGAYTVVGLEALLDPQNPESDLAIGSAAELQNNVDIASYLPRFKRIVVTAGAQGAHLYSAEGVHHQPTLATVVRDTTGAGDSFIAGFVAALAKGDLAGELGMKAGALWSAEMLTQYRSVPPNADSVDGLMQILSSIGQE